MKTKILTSLVILLIFVAAGMRNTGYEVGDTARDFSLKNVDGKMVSLSDYEDAKGYIVVFTCNTCPWSQRYEQRIIDLHNKYASQGFPVVAINPNDPQKSPGDSYEEMVKLANNKSYPFAYVIDETQEVTKDYGATNTPHVYVLNKDREVVYIGAIDNNARDASAADKLYVEEAIKAIKENKNPETPKTKALGCTIKWS